MEEATNITQATNNFEYTNIIEISYVIATIIPDFIMIYAIIANKKMRIKRNMCVLNLCLADIMYKLISIVGIGQTYLNYARLHEIFYTAIHILFFVILFTFLVDCIFETLSLRAFNIILFILWNFAVIYSLSTFIIGDDSGFGFYLLRIIPNFVLLIFFVKCCIAIVNVIRKKQMTNDQKIRFILSAICLINQFLFLIISQTKLYEIADLIRHNQKLVMVVFILILMKLDVNVRYSIIKLLPCVKNKNYVINYSCGEETGMVRVLFEL